MLDNLLCGTGLVSLVDLHVAKLNAQRLIDVLWYSVLPSWLVRPQAQHGKDVTGFRFKVDVAMVCHACCSNIQSGVRWSRYTGCRSYNVRTRGLIGGTLLSVGVAFAKVRRVTGARTESGTTCKRNACVGSLRLLQ